MTSSVFAKRISHFLFLGLFACTPYCPEGTSLPLSCTDIGIEVQKSLQTDSFCTGEFSANWWEMFHDPSLTELIQMALAYHPDMLIAEHRILLARAYALEARSRLYPHLFFLANIFGKRASKLAAEVPSGLGTFKEATLLLQACYELDIWKKNRALYYAEIGETLARIAEQQEAALLLSIAVADHYFRLQMHLREKKILQEQIEVNQELNFLTAKRMNNGISREDPVLQTDSEIRILEEELAVIEEMVAVDEHSLQALCASIVCETLDPMALCLQSSFEGKFVLPCSLPFDLLARRPDVVAQRFLVESQGFHIHAARARFFPSIDLLSFVGVQSFRLSELFTGKALTALAEAMGALPIFTGGKLEAELSEAEQEFEILLQKYNQTVINAVWEVSTAMSSLIANDQKKREVEQKVLDQQGLVFLSEKRWQSGIANRLIFLEAKSKLLEAQELLVSIELERLASVLQVIQAIGGGYDERN